LRVKLLFKTDSGCPRDAEVTLFTLITNQKPKIKKLWQTLRKTLANPGKFVLDCLG